MTGWKEQGSDTFIRLTFDCDGGWLSSRAVT
jgi:hypothetical protein